MMVREALDTLANTCDKSVSAWQASFSEAINLKKQNNPIS